RLARYPDRSAVRLDDLSNEPQPEPETAILPFGHRPLEALENTRLLLRIDADSLVAHLEPHAALHRAVDGDADRPTKAEFERVRQEVGDDLCESPLVPTADRRSGHTHGHLAA